MQNEIISTFTALKVSLYTGLTVFFLYLKIPQDQFVALGVLMLIDMAAGAYREYAISRPVTSDKAKRGLMKKVFTLVGVLSLGIGIKGNGLDGTVFLTLVLSAFIAAETYSITRNIYCIITGRFIPEFEATAIIFKAIASFLKGEVEDRAKQLEKVPGEVQEPTK